MKRAAIDELTAWLSRRGRKPLVIRGARQVGKSYLIRDFARTSSLDLVELNFERDPKAANLFADGDATRLLRNVEAFTGKRLAYGRSLLFLDEIQAAPHVLAKLRWLHEETPKLAVVAAGSLLDFALADHTFSMPVGRITYLHLEPMSFTEFLRGLDDDELAGVIDELDPWRGLNEALHARLIERFREYVLVGGMPEAVETYRQDRSLLDCARVHQDLLATFRDDFAKYASAIHRDRLVKVLDAVPRMIGRRFVYSHVDRDERAAALRQAVDLLCRARVCHRVAATHATGVPLGAEVDDRRYKLLLIDVGLVSASLGISLTDLPRPDDLVLANEGAIAEQAVGQALRLVEPSFQEPKLYYWARDKPGSEAEVDYVVQQGTKCVPTEVKAGATGALRSLHALMAARGWRRAVRFNADRPSVTQVSTVTSTGDRATYELVSLPLYLAPTVGRILRDRQPRARHG
jgi:uncharacterized protein